MLFLRLLATSVSLVAAARQASQNACQYLDSTFADITVMPKDAAYSALSTENWCVNPLCFVFQNSTSGTMMSYHPTLSTPTVLSLGLYADPPLQVCYRLGQAHLCGAATLNGRCAEDRLTSHPATGQVRDSIWRPSSFAFGCEHKRWCLD